MESNFLHQLRTYPDTSLGLGRSRLIHYRDMRTIAKQVDDECGGLLHVELAENKVSSSRASCTSALAYLVSLPSALGGFVHNTVI